MVKKIKISIFPIIVCLLSSCASNSQKYFYHNLKEGRCEEAVKHLPAEGRSVLDETQTAAGTMASYTLTGLAYGADVTVFLVGGVAVSAVICSPIIALEISGKSSGNISVECFGKAISSPLVKKAFSNDSMGKKVYRNTEKWRCPDLTEFSQNLRSIASCYENKNDQVNLEKALVQLDLLKEKNFQDNCIDESEKSMILDQYDNIHKKISLRKNSPE